MKHAHETYLDRRLALIDEEIEEANRQTVVNTWPKWASLGVGGYTSLASSAFFGTGASGRERPEESLAWIIPESDQYHLDPSPHGIQNSCRPPRGGH